jgi:anti-anti-sigma regulatory factor
VVSDAPSPSVPSDQRIVSQQTDFPGFRDTSLHDVVEVGPDLTFGTVADFRRKIIDLVALHEVRLIVDLRATERLDAMGLGALVAARRRLLASGGCLHLIAGPQAEQRLSSSGLLGLFDLAPDPESAATHGAAELPGPRSKAD